MYIYCGQPCYPHHISMLSTTYDPRYICTCVTHTIYCIVHGIYPQHISHSIYPHHMMCYPQHIAHSIYNHIPWVYDVDNLHIYCGQPCYPHHISMLSTAYDPRYICTCVTHSIYCVVHSIYPQHMFPTVYTVSSTVYVHSICIPRYISVMSTVYHPHYMYPQYITRYPQHMCYPHHMHMVWVTLTLFSTAYVPQHKM